MKTRILDEKTTDFQNNFKNAEGSFVNVLGNLNNFCPEYASKGLLKFRATNSQVINQFAKFP